MKLYGLPGGDLIDDLPPAASDLRGLCSARQKSNTKTVGLPFFWSWVSPVSSHASQPEASEPCAHMRLPLSLQKRTEAFVLL